MYEVRVVIGEVLRVKVGCLTMSQSEETRTVPRKGLSPVTLFTGKRMRLLWNGSSGLERKHQRDNVLKIFLQRILEASRL
jgi:hypothetical protein